MGRGLTDAVKHLLILNVLMFIGKMTIGQGVFFDQWFVLYFPHNEMFQPWQIVTYMFMHGDTSHLFFNMLMLFFIGPAVEMAIGTKRFVFLYLSSGLGAVVLYYGVNYTQFTFALHELVNAGLDKEAIIKVLKLGKYSIAWESIIGETKLQHLVGNFYSTNRGASGAISGILVALGILYAEKKIFLIFPPIQLKIKYLVVGMVGSDFICALLSKTTLLGQSNISYLAHVGGAVIGFIVMWYWKKNSMNKHRWN